MCMDRKIRITIHAPVNCHIYQYMSIVWNETRYTWCANKLVSAVALLPPCAIGEAHNSYAPGRPTAQAERPPPPCGHGANFVCLWIFCGSS